MKALSLTQPWATLVAIGAKQIETRSWATRYRGDLLIHSAKGFPAWARDACYAEPFASVLEEHGFGLPSMLPLGAIIARASLQACEPTEVVEACLSGNERAFGDYSSGRFAWVFRPGVRRIPLVFARGALGLWDVPPDLMHTINANLYATDEVFR